MKVGIICAGDEEFAPFLPLIKNCKKCLQTYVYMLLYLGTQYSGPRRNSGLLSYGQI